MRTRWHRPAAVAALFVLALAWNGCSDEDKGVGPTVSGTLKDPAGDPVAGAGILIEYSTDFPPKQLVLTPTWIGFKVERPGQVRVWLTQPCGERLVRVLVDGFRQAGQFSVVWDCRNDAGRLVLPGVYLAHVSAGGHEEAFNVFAFGDPFPPALPLEGREWHATTDAEGRFTVPLACLSFGEEIAITDAGGTVIGRATWPYRARIWALHPDLGALSSDGFLEVDPAAGLQVDLRYPVPPPPPAK